MKIILASKSPRRIELLKNLGLSPEIIPADVDETVNESRHPHEVVTELAVRKADLISKKYPDALVIAADTMVFKDGKLLGKPKDSKNAFAMLLSLSDSTHTVYTGIAVSLGGKTVSEAVGTQVLFRKLSDDEINSYIASGEPFDKAGAYGIQGCGALLVKEICGDYFNVVGLPVSRLFELIKESFEISYEDMKN